MMEMTLKELDLVDCVMKRMAMPMRRLRKLAFNSPGQPTHREVENYFRGMGRPEVVWHSFGVASYKGSGRYSAADEVGNSTRRE